MRIKNGSELIIKLPTTDVPVVGDLYSVNGFVVHIATINTYSKTMLGDVYGVFNILKTSATTTTDTDWKQGVAVYLNTATKGLTLTAPAATNKKTTPYVGVLAKDVKTTDDKIEIVLNA